MTLLNGSSIYEILHKKECEIEEKVRGELREELRDEVREEARTNVMNAIETLENQGKRPDEIITTLKTMF